MVQFTHHENIKLSFTLLVNNSVNQSVNLENFSNILNKLHTLIPIVNKSLTDFKFEKFEGSNFYIIWIIFFFITIYDKCKLPD